LKVESKEVAIVDSDADRLKDASLGVLQRKFTTEFAEITESE